LAYLTPKLKESVRMNGTPVVKIKASIDRPVANLTALLVDYGGDQPEIVTRGWMDPQNLESADRSLSLKPHQEYTFKWDMQPDDYVFKKGNQIGIILLASDYDYTLRPPAGTKITVVPGESEINLPIAGDAQTLNINAVSMEESIQKFQDQGHFKNHGAASSLQAHLEPVVDFEKKGKAEKVVKHMNDFISFLDKQVEKEFVSEEVYQELQEDADYVIKKWK